ncbi:putative reverse transcriptase domain-containing protein [Tanacetum coccineum]
MRQRRWIKLISDYECEIKYHPVRKIVMAGCFKQKMKRTQALASACHGMIYPVLVSRAKILEAQSKASKDFKALTEWLRGLETHFERRDDSGIYFFDQIWIPSVGGVRKLTLDEAHTTRYSVHPGVDKMYYDLRNLYWWPGMKRDIVDYVNKCLACSKIKGTSNL